MPARGCVFSSETERTPSKGPAAVAADGDRGGNCLYFRICAVFSVQSRSLRSDSCFFKICSVSQGMNRQIDAYCNRKTVGIEEKNDFPPQNLSIFEKNGPDVFFYEFPSVKHWFVSQKRRKLRFF